MLSLIEQAFVGRGEKRLRGRLGFILTNVKPLYDAYTTYLPVYDEDSMLIHNSP